MSTTRDLSTQERTASAGPSRKVTVWDPFVRLFHWAIVLLIGASWATAELGMMEWHLRSGYAVLALVVFRLAWGLVGSETARFRHFLGSPLRALAHLREFGHREPDTQVGHNAAGGWMVLVLLALLAAQVGTGLFANEEPGASYTAYGPFALHVSDHLSEVLTEVHEVLFNVIIAAVLLHVAAVLAYALVKRHDLVRPMVLGWKRLPGWVPAPQMANPLLGLALLAAAAGLAWWVSGLK